MLLRACLVHIHPAGSSLDLGENFAFRGLQQHHHLLARHGGKARQEIINRVPGLQVLEEGLDGHAGTGEDRGASHDVWRNGYQMIAHEKESKGKSGLLASGTVSSSMMPPRQGFGPRPQEEGCIGKANPPACPHAHKTRSASGSRLRGNSRNDRR